MAKTSTAHVTWQGSLHEGGGRIDEVGTGAFGPLELTWKARTEGEGATTSPEELIAAAHAACFSMALSNVLAQAGSAPERLSTSVRVDFVPGTGITESAIEVRGRVPGIDEDAFRAAAEQAKDACPVSKALAGNVELSVRASLD